MQTAKLGKFTVWYRNPEEFRLLKRDVWTRNDYYVELDTDKPTIVDGGANIGAATLYFKQMYPEARMIAVEPYPPNFELLKKNVEENQLTGVELVSAAIAAKSGEITLHADVSGFDWFTTVSVHQSGWDERQKTEPITVKAVTVHDLVPTGKIDLLKLDIEGMEETVLRGMAEELSRVRRIVAEFHPRAGKFPVELTKWLQRQGYRIEVRVEGSVKEEWEKIRELAIVTAVR